MLASAAELYLLFDPHLNEQGGDMTVQVLCDSEEILARESEIMVTMRPHLRRHILPAVQVGFGDSGFSKKMAALLHAMRLEHFNDDSLKHYLQEFVSVMSDYGTEHLLRLVSRIPLGFQGFCRHFEETLQQDIDEVAGRLETAQTADDEEVGAAGSAVFEEMVGPDGSAQPQEQALACFEGDGVFEEVPPISRVMIALPSLPSSAGAIHADPVFEEIPQPARIQGSFSNCLDCPPLHHILDNCGDGLECVMESYLPMVDLAKAVCKVVRRQTNANLVGKTSLSRAVIHQLSMQLSEYRTEANVASAQPSTTLVE